MGRRIIPVTLGLPRVFSNDRGQEVHPAADVSPKLSANCRWLLACRVVIGNTHPMPVSGCAECARLAARYASATAVRYSAEAELTAAAFAHDAKQMKLARRAVKSALEGWRRANQALVAHERTHVMTASAAPRLD